MHELGGETRASARERAIERIRTKTTFQQGIQLITQYIIAPRSIRTDRTANETKLTEK